MARGRVLSWTVSLRPLALSMSEPVLIRPATRADVDAAAALWAALQEEHEALEPRLRRSASAEARWRTDFGVWVGGQAHRVLVAEAEGEVVGLVTAHPYWPAPVYEERMEVYVTELYVREAWRGRGVARRLLAEVQAWARGLGAARIRAGVLAANPESRAFWQHLGAEDLFVMVSLPVA